MKFVLNLTFAVILVAGVYAWSLEDSDNRYKRSAKERMRFEIEHELRHYKKMEFESLCPLQLSPEQIVFGNEKYAELIECSNATSKLFFSKLDNDFKTHQLEKMYGSLCEVFDDIFRCVEQFSPVIDLCLTDLQKIFKNKLFAIEPLIHQAICLGNGVLIAEIVQNEDNYRCVYKQLEFFYDGGLLELLESESNELFGDVRVCRRFSEIVSEFYTKVGECSPDILVKVKDMLGYFCEHTQCDRFVDNMRCY